jgi:hypothetical protein
MNNKNQQDLVQQLIAAGAVVKGQDVKCPFHTDTKPSGWIKRYDDGIWRFSCCASGCGIHGDVFDIISIATGKPLGEVLKEYQDAQPGDSKFPSPKPSKSQGVVYPNLEALTQSLGNKLVMGPWIYTDALGLPVLAVFRITANDHKAYPQATPVDGGWQFRGAKPPYPLYNLKAVRDADRVLIVEGEKCVEALRSLGIAATTSAGGAGKAHLTDWSPLASKEVWLWPDNDLPDPKTLIAPGYKHMEDVTKQLGALPKRPIIRQIDPQQYNIGPKGDVADLIADYRAHRTNDATIRATISDIMDDATMLGPALGLKKLLDDIISGKRIDIPWPFMRLTNLSHALLPASVTIICGDPGGSKSFLLTQALAHWHSLGFRCAALELEDNRDYHLQRCLAQRCKRATLFDPNWIAQFPDLSRQLFAQNEDWLNDFGLCFHEAPNESTHLRHVTEWVLARVAEGVQIIAVDPITAAGKSDKSWNDDLEFITTVKAAIRQTGARIVLITHPKKGSKSAVGMDELSGSAAYQRFAHTIFWVESKPYGTKFKIARRGADGQKWIEEIEGNRIIHCTKTRNGPGHGLALGYRFIGTELLFEEIGLISYRNKDPADYSAPPAPKKSQPIESPPQPQDEELF